MEQLNPVKKSEITNFIGEVFYEEMKFLFGKNNNKAFWVKNHGMNSRAFSKDVIDVSGYSYVVHEDIIESIFIHLSRNSLYHQLPESFFHPLVISNPSMSNAEVVEAIKRNKKIEENSIQFFIPFDTALFNKKVQLTNRYVNIFTDLTSKKILFSLAEKIIDKEILFTKEQYYKLFLNLCEAENYKENLPELEKLLTRVMGYHVELAYVAHVHDDSPFLPLGKGILGYNFGTQGPTICEFEDISVTMVVEEDLDYRTIKEQMEVIKMILEFFVFSNRLVIIKYHTRREASIVLGENYLGYNTTLVA